MSRRRRLQILLLLSATVLSLVVAEAIVRAVGETDADGNFSVNGVTLLPRALPVELVRETVDQYRASRSSYLQYDPNTGWKVRPSARGRGGIYVSNRAGIRIGSQPVEYDVRSGDGRLRIVLLGDSFTHCDDVRFEESWGFFLQQSLDRLGIAAEVINFGTPGFGIDQAYLRWVHQARRYRPDVVVFGFQAENMLRSVNLFRPLYAGGDAGIPFSKPRFVIEGGELELVNSPTVPLDDLVEVLSGLADDPLNRYEAFFDPEPYRRRSYQASRLLSLLLHDELESDPIRAEERRRAGEEVSRRIIDRLGQEAQEDGAGFVILHLPREEDLTTLIDRGEAELWYATTVEWLRERHLVIDPAPELAAYAKEKARRHLYVGHFSSTGNQIIGRRLAAAMRRFQTR